MNAVVDTARGRRANTLEAKVADLTEQIAQHLTSHGSFDLCAGAERPSDVSRSRHNITVHRFDLCTERALCSAVYRRELCVRAQKMYYSNESHSNLRRNNRPRVEHGVERWNGVSPRTRECLSTDDCVVHLVRGAQAARRMLFINKSNFIYHAPHEVTKKSLCMRVLTTALPR